MEFAEVIKAYAEVGVLGLCAVLMVILFYKSYNRNNEKDNKESARVDQTNSLIQEQQSSLLKSLQEQQQKMFQLQLEQTKAMMDGFVDKVCTHTPTKEVNDKMLKISREVDYVLQDILNECGASRVSLVQYHNGGHGMNKQSFLKMSMTNERMQVGIKPLMPEFRDQFRSVLSYFVHEIDSTGKCYISDLEEIKSFDVGTYEFLKARNIQAKFGIGIKDHEGMTIAFVCAEFRFKEQVNIEKIDSVLKHKQSALTALLCTKYEGD